MRAIYLISLLLISACSSPGPTGAPQSSTPGSAAKPTAAPSPAAESNSANAEAEVPLRKEPNFFEKMRAKVQSTYSIPSGFLREKLYTAVSFQLDADGRITTLEISETSGNDEFDRIALDAVRKAQPLPKPPPEVVGKVIHITFGAT